MRVLVTGSSGLLGSEIVRQLAAAHEVLGLDLRPAPTTSIAGSIGDRQLVADLAARVDAIVHTASLHAPHVAELPRQAFVDVNVSGTLNLLEAAASAGHRWFVYTSTTSVYGHALEPTDRAVWVDESLEPRPRDIYDITKLSAEALCRDLAEREGLVVSVLRTGRFFPEPPEKTAIYRLYRGADVRDIAAAHLLALERGGSGFEIFNIASRSPFTRDDLPELFHDAPRVIARYHPDAPEAFARRGWMLPRSIDRVYVTEKAERLLGFRHRFGFAELLADLPIDGH